MEMQPVGQAGGLTYGNAAPVTVVFFGWFDTAEFDKSLAASLFRRHAAPDFLRCASYLPARRANVIAPIGKQQAGAGCAAPKTSRARTGNARGVAPFRSRPRYSKPRPRPGLGKT
ncbi:MAG: hypothetical protein ABSE86_26425 [Bryobacteraceae bacterium]